MGGEPTCRLDRSLSATEIARGPAISVCLAGFSRCAHTPNPALPKRPLIVAVFHGFDWTIKSFLYQGYSAIWCSKEAEFLQNLPGYRRHVEAALGAHISWLIWQKCFAILGSCSAQTRAAIGLPHGHGRSFPQRVHRLSLPLPTLAN